MADVVIRLEGIAKQYRIGQRQSYKTLRDALSDAVHAPFLRLRSALRYSPSAESPSEKAAIWALKDISFEVDRGEIVGIIGRNGAGKSTLLKILSRVTSPTLGYAQVWGRVGSLLEVGTGFHPELTGRENVFLNGAILGMRRTEIVRRFDEIIAFAEMEKFLDTPVKHYSSGMYMRLAFAVAAHLDTEILAVDEVLAVGDAPFQKKCLQKMGEVTSTGRTVLFVSHNMNAIEQLCGRVILLDSGHVKADSCDVRSVVTRYMSADTGEGRPSLWLRDDERFDNPYFRPTRIAIVDRDGEEISMPVRNDAEVWVQIEGEVERSDPALTVGYGLFDEGGQLLYWTCQTDQAPSDWPAIRPGFIRLRSKLPDHMLNEGSYRIELLASLHFRAWLLEPGAGSPYVGLRIQGGLSDSPYWMAKRPGVLAPVIKWHNADRRSIQDELHAES